YDPRSPGGRSGSRPNRPSLSPDAAEADQRPRSRTELDLEGGGSGGFARISSVVELLPEDQDRALERIDSAYFEGLALPVLAGKLEVLRRTVGMEREAPLIPDPRVVAAVEDRRRVAVELPDRLRA